MISYITTHFSDFEWTRKWYESIMAFRPRDYEYEIIIIDQDRSRESRERLQMLGPLIKVVQYPRSQRHFDIMGHDHAAVLNQVLRAASGEIITIWDSDAHPVSVEWWGRCLRILENYDAITARDEEYHHLAHPCFMLLKQKHLALNLRFDEPLCEHEGDTGRQIAAQLVSSGERIFLIEGSPCFGGKWGSMMLESVYHHGHGSYSGAGPRLSSQIDWRQSFFRKMVINRAKYQLGLSDRFAFKCKIKWQNAKDRIKNLVRPL